MAGTGIESELSRGGMGVVYLAQDLQVGRQVAIKRILSELIAPGRERDLFLDRFVRETEALARAAHQNIVPIYDAGEDSQGRFIVMKFYAKGTLADHVKQHGPLEESQAFDVASGLGRALHHAHQLEIIHRDVKPANVLLENDLQPALSDFGLARVGEQSLLSHTGVAAGTPVYAAPEQAASRDSISSLLDIYSLGATLYFMLTGAHPRAVREANIPAPWRAVVMRCLEEDPAARFASAAEFLEALVLVKESSGTSRSHLESAVVCPSCSTINRGAGPYCTGCGIGLYRACPQCEEEVATSSRFCPYCQFCIETANQCQAHINEAKRLRDEESFEEALQEVQRAHGLRPDHEEAQDLLREIKRIHTALSNNEESAQHHESVGDSIAAFEAWKKVLLLSPTHSRARKAMEELVPTVAAAALQRLKENAAQGSPMACLRAIHLLDEAGVDTRTTRKAIDQGLEALTDRSPTKLANDEVKTPAGLAEVLTEACHFAIALEKWKSCKQKARGPRLVETAVKTLSEIVRRQSFRKTLARYELALEIKSLGKVTTLHEELTQLCAGRDEEAMAAAESELQKLQLLFTSTCKVLDDAVSDGDVERVRSAFRDISAMDPPADVMHTYRNRRDFAIARASFEARLMAGESERARQILLKMGGLVDGSTQECFLGCRRAYAESHEAVLDEEAGEDSSTAPETSFQRSP